MSAATRWLRRVEDGSLALLLLAMITLAVTQIVLRNGFDSGITWADDAVRVGVFWIAVLGSTVATRRGSHIRIDALARLLPPGPRAVADRLVDALTAALCGALAWFAWQFVALEYADGFTAFAAVPIWVTLAILPFGFGLMTLRFALHAAVGRPSIVEQASDAAGAEAA